MRCTVVSLACPTGKFKKIAISCIKMHRFALFILKNPVIIPNTCSQEPSTAPGRSLNAKVHSA
jgi:hypothetical protein